MNSEDALYSDRLRLVFSTLATVEAAIADRGRLCRLLRAEIPDCWPQSDFAEVLPSIAAWLQQDPALGCWTCFIVHEATGRLIGEIGFKGPPDGDGAIEIGYSIVPEARRNGYATEAARTLVAWAVRRPSVRAILGETEPGNAASERVLAACGLAPVGDRDGCTQWSTPLLVQPGA